MPADLSLIELWDRALSLLSNRLSPEEVDRWLKPLKPSARTSAQTFILEAPNRFFGEWVQENYLPLVQESVSLAACKPIKTELSLALDPLKSQTKTASLVKPPTASKPDHHQKSGLNGRYKFTSFVVGESNQFAHAAAFAVANLPGANYNPLFVYSGAGLGKTHLMNAVGNHILEQNAKANVAYVSCEDFTNQMIQAIRHRTMDRFREHYRHMDVLLIDDIHFLGNKERTQEEFFFTFNALYETNRQIVLTSDQRPKEIPGLEDRLRSRFEWGLIADIQSPDRETKAAIIQKKAEEEGLVLPEEVAYCLASTDESNIRVLEGYIVRVAAYASLTGRPITLSLTKEVLSDAFIQKEITVDEIVRTVGLRYNVRLADLRSTKKHKNIAEPRQIAMFLARKLTKSSLVYIGQRLGGKDHSTVIHAVKKMQARLENDIDFRQDMAQLERSLRHQN
ncbi:MAG: chromosomal replication initiator protein DnaA [Deltaproteobacteria bacterium]|nr:chromosomal replication initiator protein DnaA [Deltaproteobacteria bacterium]